MLRLLSFIGNIVKSCEGASTKLDLNYQAEVR